MMKSTEISFSKQHQHQQHNNNKNNLKFRVFVLSGFFYVKLKIKNYKQNFAFIQLK